MDWASIGDWVKVLVSPIVTFIAFYFTYKSSKEQNAKTQLNIEEQARIAILPFLNIEISSLKPDTGTDVLVRSAIYASLPKEGGVMFSKIYSISNIGQATAVNTAISLLNVSDRSLINIGNVGKDKEVNLQFSVFMATDKKREFVLYFEDLQGHKYYQKFKLVPTNPTVNHFDAVIEELTPPQLRIGQSFV